MPTDHGSRRLRNCTEQAPRGACDRTDEPSSMTWPTVGAGLHLGVLAYARTVAHASLAGMTEVPDISESATTPAPRELAEIPAVEVITPSAVVLMGAAAAAL